MLPKEKDKSEVKAPFNMAINTLERLGNILVEIKQITNEDFSDSEKQKIKVNLVKQFFIQATPLLKVEDVKEKRREILKLSPKIIKQFRNRVGDTPVPMGYTNVYDIALENKLDGIIIDLQMLLQNGKYFMPSGSDPKYSWGQGD